MITIENIIEQLQGYYSQADQDLLIRACEFCTRAYYGQKTADGRGYLQHSLEVASILARLKVDETTLVVGILHDSLFSELVTREELAKDFGQEVLSLIETGNKISNIPYRQSNQQQVESFRKMFVAMARDLRVILVYLAVRLSDMRNISYRKEHDQINCSRETLAIYAPLANRLGISWLKGELEDLALQILEPEKYAALAQRISAHKEERGEYVNNVREKICNLLKETGLQGEVTGRFKHFYSVF